MQKLLALLGAKNKEEFVALLAQFIKFGLVGVSNTAVSMAVYYIFLWISPDLYMVGSVLGTILSIANAFFWNDKFVFTGNANDWRSKLKRQNVFRQRCGAYPARKSAVSGSLTIIRLNEVGWRCFIVENKTAKYIGKKYGKPGNI